jgi:putative hydrolase of the HAD superfamily
MKRKAVNMLLMRMNKKYTHIFFDLDNTLWDFETNSRNTMLIIFQKLNLGQTHDFSQFFETYTRHNDSLWQSYRKNEVLKKELTRLRFQNTFDELEIKGINAEEMNELYLNEMPNQKILNEGVIEILNYLKKKRYHLNIITNGFSEVQRRKIETSGLKPFFDKIFISEEIKSPKPERAIFEYAVKSSNAKKSQSLMVGDDWEVDVLGALKFGIDAVLFQSNQNENLTNVSNPLKSSCALYKIGEIGQLKYFI